MREKRGFVDKGLAADRHAIGIEPLHLNPGGTAVHTAVVIPDHDERAIRQCRDVRRILSAGGRCIDPEFASYGGCSIGFEQSREHAVAAAVTGCAGCEGRPCHDDAATVENRNGCIALCRGCFHVDLNRRTKSRSGIVELAQEHARAAAIRAAKVRIDRDNRAVGLCRQIWFVLRA